MLFCFLSKYPSAQKQTQRNWTREKRCSVLSRSETLITNPKKKSRSRGKNRQPRCMPRFSGIFGHPLPPILSLIFVRALIGREDQSYALRVSNPQQPGSIFPLPRSKVVRRYSIDRWKPWVNSLDKYHYSLGGSFRREGSRTSLFT